MDQDERKTLERRLVELKARMDTIRSKIGVPVHTDEWVKLYEEREAIDRQLDDDGEPDVRVGEYDPLG